jgi:RimJ/RimL family protein N-acetyltransferase
VRTARLTAEPISVDHLDEVWPWEADPRVARWMWPGHLGGPRTRDQSREVLGLFAAEWKRDGIGLWLWREDGVAVARGGLRHTALDDTRVIEVGWLVDPDRQGKGIATELARASVDHAFAVLGFDLVTARTLPDNFASRRVMEKLGMTYDRDIVHAGLPHVHYVLGPQP